MTAPCRGKTESLRRTHRLSGTFRKGADQACPEVPQPFWIDSDFISRLKKLKIELELSQQSSQIGIIKAGCARNRGATRVYIQSINNVVL
jgi:hypothetical protein